MFTVYSKPSCPNCESLKMYLTSRGFKFNVVDVTTDPEGMSILRGLSLRELPQMFEGDNLIGNFMKSKQYLDQKEMDFEL